MVLPDDNLNKETDDILSIMEIFTEMNTNTQNITKMVDNMITRVKNGELSTSQGLNFLEIKYHNLLSYLINLTTVIVKKVNGDKLENHRAIERLIELRVVLEKIKPIEHKLKYQIDKLLKSIVSNQKTSDNPELLTANLSNFIESDVDSNEEKSDKEESSKNKIYVPSKLTAVHYIDGNREKSNMNKRKSIYNNSSIIDDLREEYLDTPQELANENTIQQKISKYEQEKIEYEESYFTRLPVTKAEKNVRKRLSLHGGLEELASFRDTTSSLSANKKRSKKFKKFGKNKKRRLN